MANEVLFIKDQQEKSQRRWSDDIRSSDIEDLQFLLQCDVINQYLPEIGKAQWQILYRTADHAPHRFGIWCALMDKKGVERAMNHDNWDLPIGSGLPGLNHSWDDNNEIITYHRYTSDSGIRPLVWCRSFQNVFPAYTELDEEFRLYHNLAEDRENKRLLTFDSSGREIEVVRIKPDNVEAHLMYLRQYQAGTEMYLAFFLDSIRYSRIPLDNMPAKDRNRRKQEDLRRWSRLIERCDFNNEFRTFSRLLAKVILPPPPREQAGIYPFETNGKEVEFIIGIDENGAEVQYTSHPEKLRNGFNADPGAPHYLTPVYFRREVLGKYYGEPERYRVEDGRLYCLSLWSCQIDNDINGSYVAVFLGDLGRYLPYEERLHWRQYNILLEGSISETNFRRSVLAQFVDAKTPDLMFRKEYVEIIRDWEKKYGWPLFLPPMLEDNYLIETVRVPTTNSQSEFDEQILRLTKLLVDSLNKAKLIAHGTSTTPSNTKIKNTKSIDALAKFLETTQFPRHQSIILWFRNLQKLRSDGSAHRKGSAYHNAVTELNLDSNQKPDSMRILLTKATAILQKLHRHYCQDTPSRTQEFPSNLHKK